MARENRVVGSSIVRGGDNAEILAPRAVSEKLGEINHG